MNALTQIRSRGPAMPPKAAAPAVFAQRKSTLAGSAAAAPLLDMGRPLDPAVRSEMESGFNRSFEGVRVHDDARAHDSARELGALAYAAGDHVVFGEGQYAPETPSGRALIAHELAHTVQQGGVQLKADGPLDTSVDQGLEHQADRAAEAVTGGRPAPALTHVGRPILSRADQPKGGGNTLPANPGPSPSLPPGMTVDAPQPENVGTDRLVLRVAEFTLPHVKGPGSWVQAAYDTHADSKRLIFNPLFNGKTVATWESVAAYKEGSENYKSIWLARHGFKSLKSIAAAFKQKAAGKNKDERVAKAVKDAKVAPILAGFGHDSLKSAKCDIDHIVEKQLQGSSEPANLQLLTSAKNQASGRETYQGLVKLVQSLEKTPYGSVRDLQIAFTKITVPNDGETDDGSFQIETLLREVVKGSDEIAANAEGDPLTLSAGGGAETMRVRKTDDTPIDFNFKRIIPGMRLTRYIRGKKAPAPDTLEAVLDGKLVKTTETKKDEVIHLDAVLDTAVTAPAVPSTDTGTENPVAERRVVKMRKADKDRKIGFYYPYLSPGWAKVDLDSAGNAVGEGEIKPTLAFLPTVKIRFAPNVLEAVAPLPAKAFKPLFPGFRFTDGALKLQLSPSFVPSGNISFAIGPTAKPLLLGDIEAKLEGPVFVATGELRPGIAIPGLEGVSGKVTYHSEKGWNGALTASSSKIPHTKIDVTVGFHEEGKQLKVTAVGGLTVKLPRRENDIELEAFWGEGNLGFRTRKDIRWNKPVPMVDYIDVGALFVNGFLRVKGKGGFTFRESWHGDIELTYERSATGNDKFYGKGSVNVVTPNKKGKGKVTVEIDEDGRVFGAGKLSYIFTTKPLIEPEVEVALDKKGHLSIAAAVTLAGPYEIFPRYPKGNQFAKDMLQNSPVTLTEAPSNSGLKKLIEFSTPKIRIPTPIPTVNGFLEFYAGVFYEIYFGPGALKAIRISGKIDDLTENPKIEAKIEGMFFCGAGAGLYGRFGGYAGVEVLYGAGELKGGVHLQPGIKGDANIEIPLEGEYKNNDFAVRVTPTFNVKATALLDVFGTITASAFWGFLSKTWRFDIAHWEQELAKKTIAFPKLELSTSTSTGLPGSDGLSEMPKVSPIQMIEDLITHKGGDKAERDPTQDPNRPPPRDYVGNKI